MKIKILLFAILCSLCIVNCSKNEDETPNETCEKTCDTGFVLNEETCECEEEPCTKTCDTGFTLNSDTCECEEDEEPVTYPYVEEGVKYGENYVVFEPEITKSNLDTWVVRNKGEAGYFPETEHMQMWNASELKSAINDSYLEFTGNNLNGGVPKSPLVYTFTCPKTAKYRLAMRMLQPLHECTAGSTHCADTGYEKGDKRNDCWVKLEGDFTSGNHVPLTELKKDNKFWGRGVRKWGSCHSIEAHLANGNKANVNAYYNLTKGETYTFTISGRAQGCSIDYVLFYESSLEESLEIEVTTHTDPATTFPEEYRPDMLP